MSLNDGTGDFWDETAPADSDIESFGAEEIRDLRIGTRLRMGKEHIGNASGIVGGEHRPGSAKAYYLSGAPTTRPDGVTTFDGDDAGRFYINSSTLKLTAFNGSAFVDIAVGFATTVPDGSITGTKIAATTIAAGNIINNTITATKIANGTITSTQIAAGGISAANIANNSLGDTQITAGGIGTASLANGSVTGPKMAAGTVGNFVTGQYTGNGSASPGNVISLGFIPDVVWIYNTNASNAVCTSINKGSMPTRLRNIGLDTGSFNGPTAISFTGTGFTLFGSDPVFNQNGSTYYYVAIKGN